MQLTLTRQIQQVLETALLENPDFCPRYKDEAQQAVKVSLDDDSTVGVSLGLLREVVRFMNQRQPGRYWFHELVRGSGVYVEPKPEEDPEVKAAREALLEKFRIEQQNREYAEMVSSALTPQDQWMAFRPGELKEVQTHVITIVNILFSMVAVSVAIYLGSRTMTQDIGMRVLLSLAGAIIIGAVETTLYMNYAKAALSPPNDRKKVKKKKLKAIKNNKDQGS